jgi:hypothetical protein
MSNEGILDQIRGELRTAEHARRIGNEGMMRVCARRAAGAAVLHWRKANQRPGWGSDALSQLRHLQQESTIPPIVREAAMRLTARTTEQFTSPFTTDPVEDCLMIIEHLLGVRP